MSEKTAEQEQAAYNDLSPKDAAPLIGCKTAAHVRNLIRAGQIEATDVSCGGVPRYVVSLAAIAAFRQRRKVLARGQ